jgi:hypothetical protein
MEYHYQQVAEPEKTVAAKRNWLAPTLLAIGVAGVIAVAALNPDIARKLVISIDSFGVTPMGQEEISRRHTINNLPITYEEKQILINRTVFLGATTEMVVLALGQPRKGTRGLSADGSESINLVYHFPDDPLPTVLTFEGNKLVRAQKKAGIDIDSFAIDSTAN